MAKRKVFQISQALTDGLEETISAAHNYSGALRVEVIPLKKIELDPENPREISLSLDDLEGGQYNLSSLNELKRQELAALETLAESIKKEGLINPILVYKHGDKYRLIAGERRTLASHLAGKPDIQAKILDKKPTDYRLSLLQWIENIEREDLSLWERLKNLEKLIASYLKEAGDSITKLTPTLLSSIIGCSLPHAINYSAVLDADNTLKQLIQDNKIKNLEKAALITKITNPRLREQAIESCLQGATLKELKNISQNKKAKVEKEAALNKSITSAKPQTRGRIATRVNLGSTKNVQAIRFLFNAVIENSKYQHLRDNIQQIDWNDYKSVTDSFKQLIAILEENER